MLFFLTGDIQIGKTRWLESIIDELNQSSVPVYGVIAPGRWVEREGGFEKLGIDNMLLPQGERIAFAEPAEKGWTFHESAIERVNSHLQNLAEISAWKERPEDDASDAAREDVAQKDTAHNDVAWENAAREDVVREDVARGNFCRSARPGLLVIDELGWMELLKGGGLTWAMHLLDAGCTRIFPHAIVVVRETLLPHAQSHFADANWHGVLVVRPTEADRETVLDVVSSLRS